MAKRATARKRPSDAEKVFAALFRLVVESGWRRTTLAAVAAEARLPLSAVLAVAPGRLALLDAFARHIDAKVVAQPIEIDPEEGPRDRLFELLMRRFDALGPYRQGIAALAARPGSIDPCAAAIGICNVARAMALTLEAAGLSSAGLIGLARVKGLAAVYLWALRAWLSEEPGDMARTMAALDQGLRRAESLAEMVRLRRRHAPEAEDEAPA